MRNPVIQCVLVLLCFGICGCGSKQEKLANRMVGSMNAFADRLSQIKTSADVDSAQPDLQSIVNDLKEEADKGKAMGDPTGDEKAALEAKFKPQMEAAQKRMESEMMRIAGSAGPEAAMKLATMMQALNFGSDTGGQ